MTMLTISQAAAATGVAASTLTHAIKAGRLSAHTNASGQWEVDPVALFTLYPPISHAGPPPPSGAPPTEAESARLKADYAAIRQDLASLMEALASIGVTPRNLDTRPHP